MGALHWQLQPLRVHMVIFVITFIYGTLFMNPDMDLAYQIRLLSFRGLMTLPFRLYAAFFRHRGISHSLLWGTLTRIGWLALFFWGVSILFYKVTFPKETIFAAFIHHPKFWIYGFLGLFLADISHVVLDRMRKG